MTEVNWDHFDDLIEGYAAATAFHDRVPDLERELSALCKGMTLSQPEFGDFSYLLETRARHRDEVLRKTAWLAQHLFDARAWCVGQKIIIKRGKNSFSPLAAQVERLGWQEGKRVDLERMEGDWRKSDLQYRKTIDAMLADSMERVIYLVNGISFGQLNKMSRGRVSVGTEEDHLFGPSEGFLQNHRASSAVVGSLLRAKELLRAIFPEGEIRLLVGIVDDPEGSWHFQFHDVSCVSASALCGSFVDLADYPVFKTHLDYRELLSGNGDAFAALPRWANWDFLREAPVDRPIRSLMLLGELWEDQRNSPHRLVTLNANELASRVAKKYGIVYPNDLSRHDIEDCLGRGRFIRRARDGRNAYGLLPKGLARFAMITQKFSPMVQPAPNILLKGVAGISRQWATASAI